MLQLLNDPPSDNSDASGEQPATQTEPPTAEPAGEPATDPTPPVVAPPNTSGLSLEKIRAEHEPQVPPTNASSCALFDAALGSLYVTMPLYLYQSVSLYLTVSFCLSL